MDLHFNEEKQETFSENIIKVVGIGGAGNNAVNHMYERKVDGIDYVICNTDIQDLQHSPVPHKLQIGIRLTEGLGAGSIPQSGRDAAEESEEELRKMLKGSGATKMVILAAGMGGGTGTGASPVVARIAQELGLVVVSIVTTPFGFERQRLKEAVDGIKVLQEVSDAILIINNQKLQRIYGNLSFPEACEKANDVLVMATRSISEIVTQTAEQNIDYSDLERMLRGSGMAVFGVGTANGGEDRIGKAIEAALYSPLLDNCDILGAQSLLVNVVLGSRNLSVAEKKSVGDYMRRMAGRYREMKQGTRIDETLEPDEVMITVVATNFVDKEDVPSERENVIHSPQIAVEEENAEWMQVENSKQIEENARKRREERERKRRQREMAREKAKQRAQEEEARMAGVTEKMPEASGNKKRIDPIEEFKKSQTHTKRSNTLQGFIDFFGGTDVRDDVEM